MIDMKLNNDVSLAKNNNNSLAGWAGHCSAILSGIDNLGGTRSLLCSAILYHHCQLLLPLTYCFSGFDKLNPKNTVAMPIFHNKTICIFILDLEFSPISLFLLEACYDRTVIFEI